ncbi:MAG: histone deacetylase [Treponema sp.]|jgi:acetoin utilization deacetylase AcuC-like enzyme|nr:histone deacetylase [Treponema sp.]
MILYHPSMALNMGDYGISIPIHTDKNKMVLDTLKAGALKDIPETLWLRGPEFFAEIAQEDILRVHSPDYVHRLFSPGGIDKEIIEAYELDTLSGNGKRWNPSKLARPLKDFLTLSLINAGGTYTCGLTALEFRTGKQTGFACFLGGGNHHAQRDYGKGFCIINDVVVSLRKLQAEGRIRTAWVVDTDAHKGDGTAALTWGDSSIRTLSIHMERGWPLNEPGYDPNAVYDPSVSTDFNPSFTPSDIDIGIPEGRDADYIPRLAEGLSRLEELLPRPDIALVVGGVDPYEKDELASTKPLQLTKETLFDRDMLVYNFLRERHIPTAWTTAGGYGAYSWEIHVNFLGHIMPQRTAAAHL